MNSLKTHRIASIAARMVGTVSSPLALRALALIDGERVSSAPSIIGSFEQSAAATNADKDLSEQGKATRVRSAAESRLVSLSSTAKEFVALQNEHGHKQAKAMRDAVPPATDTGQVLIDLAIAAQVKADRPLMFTIERSSERVRQALARTPPELSGITAEQQSRVVGSLVSPALAAELGEEAAALEGVRSVIQSGIDELQAVARCEPKELVARFGTDWKLPGIVDSLMRRLDAENAVSEAATA